MPDKLLLFLAEELDADVSELDENSGPENTDAWDSLAAMRLVAAIEDEFEVSLSTADIMFMNTVGRVREVLIKKGANVDAAA